MAATTAITQSDRGDRLLARQGRKGRRRPRSATTLLSIGFGVALIGLALPRLAGEGMLLAARDGLLSATNPPAAQDLPVIAGQLTQAARLSLLAPAFAEAGTTWLRLSQQDRQAGPAALQAAAQALGHSLALAPAEPLVWYRLSYAAYQLGRWEEAAHAWRMAVRTGAFDPQMMEYRLTLGFTLWPHMDAADRSALGHQLVTFWSWGPGRVSEVTERDSARAIVRQVLADRPDIVADIERRIALRQGN